MVPSGYHALQTYKLFTCTEHLLILADVTYSCQVGLSATLKLHRFRISELAASFEFTMRSTPANFYSNQTCSQGVMSVLGFCIQKWKNLCRALSTATSCNEIFLTPYHEPKRPQPERTLPSIVEDGVEHYDIKEIMDSRLNHGRLQYLVQ